jgi:lipopolysaccharide/colanic/teichoic acid biosynthesis glycosyltransferase
MRAPDSHGAESSSADEALSRALERERAEQPEVRYEDVPREGQPTSRGRRIATTTGFVTLLLAATGLALAFDTLLENKSGVVEGIVSGLAALGGLALGAGTSLEIERRRRATYRHLQGDAIKKHLGALAVKRLIDVAFSSFAIVISGPLLVIMAIALKLEDPKAPVIFSQARIGRAGMIFMLLKFRTFQVTTDGSLRLGPVGRLLQLTALDELPQLINVLKGDMSLVGPRPIRPLEPIQTAWWTSHSFAPGLTGLAQLGGVELSIQDREELDVRYERTWSPLLDIQIVLRTVAAVLRP